MLGDFHCVLTTEDRMFRSPVSLNELKEYKECVESFELEEMKWTGCTYTWYKNHEEGHQIYSRIDRVFMNYHWSQAYVGTEAVFLPAGLSDHSPMVIKIHRGEKEGAFSVFQYVAL